MRPIWGSIHLSVRRMVHPSVCPLVTCFFLNAKKWTVIFLKNHRLWYRCAWYARCAWCSECAYFTQGRIIGLLTSACPSYQILRVKEGWNWMKQCKCENTSEGMVMASKIREIHIESNKGGYEMASKGFWEPRRRFGESQRGLCTEGP